MTKSPSAIYTVKHERGWKVEDVRIGSLTFERAEKGYTHSQTKICLQLRRKIERDFGVDPGFIYYEELTFAKRRDVPAGAKLPPKMRPIRDTRRHALRNSRK